MILVRVHGQWPSLIKTKFSMILQTVNTMPKTTSTKDHTSFIFFVQQQLIMKDLT